MRVLVDTSVWADFANGYSTRESDLLARLIADDSELATCGIIVTEFLQGLRSRESVERFRFLFRDMDWLTPAEPSTYEAAADLFRRLRGKGVTVRSATDCIIAELAVEAGCLLLAKDRDMLLIAESGELDIRLA